MHLQAAKPTTLFAKGWNVFVLPEGSSNNTLTLSTSGWLQANFPLHTASVQTCCPIQLHRAKRPFCVATSQMKPLPPSPQNVKFIFPQGIVNECHGIHLFFCWSGCICQRNQEKLIQVDSFINGLSLLPLCLR